MSLINFLNAKLKPSVECETISEEGYEAANLIADNEKGFMGFVVEKPPCYLIFSFPKAIDLKVLKLWNTQGANLRSTAFEVHSKYEGNWERIATIRDLEKGVDTVTFCYQSELKGKEVQQEGNVFAFFFKTAHKILSNTNSIKITIRATQKCVPVLRKAQAWGLPSRKLEKADRELILSIWRETITVCEDKNHQQEQQASGQRSPSRVPELNAHSKLDIPEEFLDAITWEIMVFPTILPSGKIVDQSTIDKHSEVEAVWGRTPSDPFTGLEFTTQRKAILDVALKMRIEKFLSENSAQFKTIPRSLGSRMRRKNRHVSQLANANCKSPDSMLVGTYSTLSNLRRTRTRSPPSTITHSLSSSSISTDLQPPLAKQSKFSNVLTSTYRTETPLFTSTKQSMSSFIPVTTSATLTSLSTQQQHNPNSLDDAIKRALQHITRYTIPAAAAAETKSPCCINCESEEFAYKIQTCCHLVCRDCLVQLSNDKMCTCKTSFRNNDIERFHKF